MQRKKGVVERGGGIEHFMEKVQIRRANCNRKRGKYCRAKCKERRKRLHNRVRRRVCVWGGGKQGLPVGGEAGGALPGSFFHLLFHSWQICDEWIFTRPWNHSPLPRDILFNPPAGSRPDPSSGRRGVSPPTPAGHGRQ